MTTIKEHIEAIRNADECEIMEYPFEELFDLIDGLKGELEDLKSDIGKHLQAIADLEAAIACG